MNGLLTDNTFKMTSIVKMTDARIKKINMGDLGLILKSIGGIEARLLIKAIKEMCEDTNNDDAKERAASILTFATFRTMEKVTKKEHEEWMNNEK